MDEHQVRVLSRIVDKVDGYRTGRLAARQALDDIWGLYTAADLGSTGGGRRFAELYLAATAADDARQDFMPAELGTDADFEAAFDALRDWAIRLGEPAGGPPTFDTGDGRTE